MENVTYHFYPTLLNHFFRYQQNDNEEAKLELLKSINRQRTFSEEQLQKMKNGSKFEDAVLKETAHHFQPEIINKVKTLLPTAFKTQVLVSFMFENIKFYGYADVVGQNRIIDLKFTHQHKADRHLFNFQNLYLFALKNWGFTQMEYIISDNEKVYQEQYDLKSYDFDFLLQKMTEFRDFVDENRGYITDKKIVQPQAAGLFN